KLRGPPTQPNRGKDGRNPDPQPFGVANGEPSGIADATELHELRIYVFRGVFDLSDVQLFGGVLDVALNCGICQREAPRRVEEFDWIEIRLDLGIALLQRGEPL